MKTETIYCLFIFLLLTSCGVKQISTDHFTPINDLSELNGIYINKSGDKYLSSVLSENYSSDKGKFIDLINLFFPSKDSLIVSYVDGAGHRESLKLKGEFKNNYFEYYLEKNRLYVPPFLMRHWTSKRRIGKDSEGKLEIHEYQNNWGALFIIYGGSSNTKSETFELYSKNLNTKLFKINTDDKWGYKNRKDSIVINPQYEYVQIFENGLAKVSLNNK